MHLFATVRMKTGWEWGLRDHFFYQTMDIVYSCDDDE